MTFPIVRPRRLRGRAAIRRVVAETRLHPAQFVLPVFVVPGEGVRKPIESMPGHSQLSVDQVALLAKEAEAVGVGGIIFFGVPDHKDEVGLRSLGHGRPRSQGHRSGGGVGPRPGALGRRMPV